MQQQDKLKLSEDVNQLNLNKDLWTTHKYAIIDEFLPRLHSQAINTAIKQ